MNSLKKIVYLVTSLLPIATTAISESKPNIVLVMMDDVSPDMFGAYGATDAKTPTVDRWAKQGVMFKSAWGSAICCPARAEIMTGKYGTKTGFYYNGFAVPQKDGSNNLFKHHASFARLMQEAGYATAVAGKWHIGAAENPDEKIVGFDEYCLWEGKKELDALPGKPKHTGLWEDDKTPSRFWGPCIVKNHKYMKLKNSDFGPDVFTKFICEFIEKNAKVKKPFLAYYPMVAPHGTRSGQTTCPIRRGVGPIMGHKEDNQKRFRALCDYIDILMGRIEKKINDLGVADNTLIIFCADNGTAVTAKSRGVERGSHVPFIAFGPMVKKRGATNELCDLSDILPSLVDYANGEVPCDVDGKSLKPFLSGKTDNHREYIFSAVGTTRLVRSKDFMLEVVNEVLNVPEGRFYKTNGSSNGRGYERIRNNPEYVQARSEFENILQKHPGLTKNHPYFKEKKGKKWLESYTKPSSIKKHLHNHKHYQFYDETD